MTELLPCPFCGGEAEFERRGDRRQSTIVRCTSCGCSLESGAEWDHEKDWNNRPAPVVSEAMVEAVAKVIYEADPFYEGGEYVDAFLVSPGFTLTWEQACDRDAEFAGVEFMLPITRAPREKARAALISALGAKP